MWISDSSTLMFKSKLDTYSINVVRPSPAKQNTGCDGLVGGGKEYETEALLKVYRTFFFSYEIQARYMSQ